MGNLRHWLYFLGSVALGCVKEVRLKKSADYRRWKKLKVVQPEWWAERQRRIEELRNLHERRLGRTEVGDDLCLCGHWRSNHKRWCGLCAAKDCNCRHYCNFSGKSLNRTKPKGLINAS